MHACGDDGKRHHIIRSAPVVVETCGGCRFEFDARIILAATPPKPCCTRWSAGESTLFILHLLCLGAHRCIMLDAAPSTSYCITRCCQCCQCCQNCPTVSTLPQPTTAGPVTGPPNYEMDSPNSTLVPSWGIYQY
ncbi:hypothetical protein IF2G_01690 [Cordyceps javanica]|nr:hypothetical protein IF2G_01690 [Cordyceps javanica]